MTRSLEVIAQKISEIEAEASRTGNDPTAIDHRYDNLRNIVKMYNEQSPDMTLDKAFEMVYSLAIDMLDTPVLFESDDPELINVINQHIAVDMFKQFVLDNTDQNEQ